MYLDGKQKYFIGVELDIPRKATLAQVGETVVSRCFVGCPRQARKRCSDRCAVVVHGTMQATFGRPTYLQQVEFPSQTLAPGVVFRTATTAGLIYI